MVKWPVSFRQKKPHHVLSEEPLAPPPTTKAEAIAIKALAAGDASQEQQRLAFDWILYSACGMLDEPYRPERPQDTAFMLGRGRVARAIMAIISKPVSDLQEE